MAPFVQDPRVVDDPLPKVIDYKAKVKPNDIWADFPVSATSYDQGYRSFTYAELANAVNGAARWLLDTLGAPKKKNEVLAYMGPNDLRCPALAIGAAKIGYVTFFTSPRNSQAAHADLLDRLECTTVLSEAPHQPAITALADEGRLKIQDLPDESILTGRKHEHVLYEKTIEEVANDSLFWVHTSGSTGIPKPLNITHSIMHAYTKLATLPGLEGHETLAGRFFQKSGLTLSPPFHVMYVMIMFCFSMRLGMVYVLPAAKAIPSAVGVAQALKQRPCQMALLPPSIIQDLSHDPNLLDTVAQNVEHVMYGGGDLPQSTGDRVISKVSLINAYGATEMGMMPLLFAKDRKPEDWKYLHFHPNVGYDLRLYNDDVYEIVIDRKKQDPEWQVPFKFFPELEEYRPRDLWKRHPTHPDMYKWVARADDIIVFLNGEKTNPISMEMHITGSNPEIAAALVFGAQRFQAGLLVEVSGATEPVPTSERARLIEKIWPSIEEANQECPAHARIDKSHITFVDPHKPMPRAVKGTVQRYATLILYKDEIDRLYDDAEALDEPSDVPDQDIDLGNQATVADFITKSVLSVTKWDKVNPSDDLFGNGMDSLQGLMILRKLRTGFRRPKMALTQIYANPTIDALAAAICKQPGDSPETSSSTKETLLQARSDLMQRFKAEIDTITTPRAPPLPTPTSHHTFILTGSTGALGSYMLTYLLSLPTTAHIYCLNRAADSGALQSRRNATRGLPSTFPPERVTFLTADLTAPGFSLPPATYSKLAEETTIILHNAWPVNFNHPLPSFTPSLATIPSLLRLAAEGKHRPHVHFVSSIGAAIAYRPRPGAPDVIPAEPFDDPEAVTDAGGYGHSKQLGELLLQYASQRLPISVSFARVGQIAGAVGRKGLWNPAEWFPSIVLSSRYVGAWPESLGGMGRVDWMPVDLLSEAIVDLVRGVAEKGVDGKGVLDVFHPHNPTAKTWEEGTQVVLEELRRLTPGREFEVVSLREWIARVKSAMEDPPERAASDGANGTKSNGSDGSNSDSNSNSNSNGDGNGNGTKTPPTPTSLAASASGKDSGKDSAKASAVSSDKDIEERLRLNPAAKLLDFYEGLAAESEAGLPTPFEVESTVGRSKVLEGLRGVGVRDEWIGKWVGEVVGWVDGK